ncbi:uncharacterized protein PGTG_22283 [Puccinia graminis f. sp. tritici CRL 75-36-700-3]|uniref:Uncharacterized protein n=1 Tax=Puccinia graminis f. sp. tritici (strain CRL 75-36-700-3 / race SCCL) TaxID=418459 RepID=H6QU98_PUCGT|nr:uncharacterized protein PGTG_22283 [Puccinia graminis f. sp. tritici CRL 75-36-700-3]EHS64561.1 hypothetical protein PGTG_22283 [Puccinia graminis f. sp. tritici CRL 75-36-700-3]
MSKFLRQKSCNCQDEDSSTALEATNTLLRQITNHIEAQENIHVDPNQAQDTMHSSLMEE